MGKNKKVGIVTLHGYQNYGNRLQNYALLEILKSLNYDVSTTVINHGAKINFIRRIKNGLKLKPNQVLPKLKGKICKNPAIELLNKNRKKHFIAFSEEFLNEEFLFLDNNRHKNYLNEFNYFVTGSDQVWNPIYYINLPIYFLTFIQKEKRIAYSPSISREEIPKKLKPQYKRWLKGMTGISIREDAGARIIKDIINVEVPVHVDPTLLLTKEQWINISKPAKNRPDSPYILTYFLGGPSDETRKEVSKIAKKRRMKILNLGDITEKETYETGPREFLDYINNASVFFTDSFHGVVFSLLFETPFIVFERKSSGASMYSRIETLLNKFDMRNRESKGFIGDVFSMDFINVKPILKEEYKKSMDYLKDQL